MADDHLAAFETSHQATQSPEVQAVYAAFDRNPGPAKMRPHNYAMLVSACRESGVRLGTYDRDVLEWLAEWEPPTCAAIARMIRRAFEAGKEASGGK